MASLSMSRISGFVRNASRAAPVPVARALRTGPISRRASVAVRANAPLVGTAAPDFTAQAVESTSSSSSTPWTSPLHAEFAEMNTEILGVSIDSQFTHLAWIQTERNEGGLGDLAYPLVSDLKRTIAESYGVLSPDGIALRGLFIIDKEGNVQHSTINNLGFGRSVDETKRVLQAIQYIQDHPDEVCPAGWKPGDATMNPSPKASKEFFKKL
eukprot:gene24478-10086_t